MKKKLTVFILLLAAALPCVQAKSDTSKAFSQHWAQEYHATPTPAPDLGKGDMRRVGGPFQFLMHLIFGI